MKNILLSGLAALLLLSCKKESFFEKPAHNDQYETFTIQKGNHYCDKSVVKAFKSDILTYQVMFDSSAIYTVENKNNQLDINKLFGFSDNGAAHHDFSARFGWRWSDNALRLFAYVYNNGKMSFKEIQKVEIGQEYSCSIMIRQHEYAFVVNGREITMPRASEASPAEGYLLWPYFGGDESAPHQVTILMKRSQ